MKIYRNLWVGSGGSPNPRVKAAVSIPAGKRKVVRVAGPAEGRVARLYVKQKTGGAAAFNVYLLSSALPYGDELADDGSLAAYDAAATADPDLFAVIDKLTVLSGAAGSFRDAVGHPYANDDLTKFTKADEFRFFYLVIIPTAAAGTTTWEVAVTTVEAVYN